MQAKGVNTELPTHLTGSLNSKNFTRRKPLTYCFIHNDDSTCPPSVVYDLLLVIYFKCHSLAEVKGPPATHLPHPATFMNILGSSVSKTGHGQVRIQQGAAPKSSSLPLLPKLNTYYLFN